MRIQISIYTSLATRSDDLKGGASDECGPGRGVLRECHPEVSQHLSDFPFPGKAQRETPFANSAASWIDFRKIRLAGLAGAGGRFGDIPSKKKYKVFDLICFKRLRLSSWTDP